MRNRGFWPCDIQTWPFEACWAYLVPKFFYLFRKKGRSRGRNWENVRSPKKNEIQGFLTLGHSNWTICLFSWFCSKKIYLLNFHTGRTNFLLPQREEGAMAENGGKGITQKWMRLRGFLPWGIQTGPFAACFADFVPKKFKLLNFHTGRTNFLLPQRE